MQPILVYAIIISFLLVNQILVVIAEATAFKAS